MPIIIRARARMSKLQPKKDLELDLESAQRFEKS
jgi:hypothetical protein